VWQHTEDNKGNYHRKSLSCSLFYPSANIWRERLRAFKNIWGTILCVKGIYTTKYGVRAIINRGNVECLLRLLIWCFQSILNTVWNKVCLRKSPDAWLQEVVRNIVQAFFVESLRQ
jgi:hypothetical protein